MKLTDVTAAAGVTFVHQSGAFGKKYLPETLGAGGAFFDADADGDQDLLLVNGTTWPGQRKAAPYLSRLYRNGGRGVFTDVTAGSGLDVELYGMGAAAADFDNDGLQDVLLTAVGQNRLFRNAGGAKFVDVTDTAGLGRRQGFSTSALWFDYDRDGWLDLLVLNYVKWTPETDIYCSADGRQKSYCTPEAYRGATSWLFHNRKDGTFEDVTAKSGLFDPTSKSLGVAMFDHDQDGWPDLVVANDTQPNKLYRNNRDGTFAEIGLQAGLAFSEEGRARAGMGVDAADVDGSGRPAVVVTNFSGEMLGLYVPAGRGQYADQAPRSDIGTATRNTLGFGCLFADVDLDGLQDLVVVNGHIDPSFTAAQARISYAEAPHLFLNAGGGRFRDIVKEVGGGFARPKVARGAAYADIDADGDADLLITTNGGPAFLYRNDTPRAAGAVRIRLRGGPSNRDAIGAVVRVAAGSARAWRMVRTGSSYLSQSELPLTFGLGAQAAAERVTVEWPSGRKEDLGTLAAGFTYDVVEGKGVASKTPFRR